MFAIMSPAPTRRRLLAATAAASVTGLAGCSTVFGSTSGDLFVDIQNEGGVPRDLQVSLTVEEEQPPSIDRTITVESESTARLHRANVFEGESYRVNAVTNTDRAERTDTADCIGQRREEGEESPYFEQVTAVVGAETVELMTESC
jgi:hypothetical protein